MNTEESVKHTVTIQVSPRTWELLEWLCRFDYRNPRQQVSYFLNILSGESVPTEPRCSKLYNPLCGVLKRFKEKVENLPSADMENPLEHKNNEPAIIPSHGIVLEFPLGKRLSTG